MASVIPKTYRKEITDALEVETLWVALFTNSMSTWTGLNAAEKTYTQVAAVYTESTGVGYTVGGKALGGTNSGYLGASNIVVITVDVNTTWTITTALTARYAVIYEFTSKNIRAVVDLGGDKTVTSGTFTITWDAINGLIKVS